MPQGPDISKVIRTMRKDIDQARKGGPVEEYIPPVIQKPADSIPVKKPAGFSNPVSSASTLAGLKGEGQSQQMQSIAEEKQRIEKLRIEEQKRKEVEAMVKKQEEERIKKIEESKKEEERVRKYKEEQAKKAQEELKRKALEAEQARKQKIQRIKEYILKEDLSAKKGEILEERKNLDKDKNGLNFQLKEASNLKKPLENEKNSHSRRISELKNSHKQLALKEAQIENEKRSIEEKESSSSDGEERKKLEKERWQIGEKRREVEKKRWAIEEEIKSLESKIEDLDLKYRPIREKEESIKRRISEFEMRENDLRDKIREVELKEEFKKSEELWDLVEKKASKLRDSAVEISRKLKIVTNEEKLAEIEEKSIEEKEKLSDDLSERKKTEEKRWLVEKQRREIEKKRWQLESMKKEVEFDLRSAEKASDDLKAKRQSMFAELEKTVKIEEPEIKKEIVFEKPVEKKPEPVIPKKKAEPPVFEIKEEIVLPNPIQKPLEKKTEELKKEDIIEEKAGVEITTPIKEIKKPVFEKVQNEPVKKEIQPIPQVQPQPNIAPQIKNESSPIKSILTAHPLPKKAGVGRKVFARILAISLLAALLFFNITFWYWYLVIRQPEEPIASQTPTPSVLRECETDEDCDVGKTCDQSGKCISKPVTVLSSLFNMAEEEKYKVLDYSDIPGIILSVASDWPNKEGYAVDKFKRLVIINEKEGRVATVKEIFDSLLISVPEGFYERLGDNYTLFAYSQKEGVRIGLVSLIIDSENFRKLLLQNEGTMKDSFVPLFSLMNMESPLTTKTFSNASKVKGYAGTDFRFLPIAKNDLGICYSVYDKYFVFGSSFESTKKVLEALKPSPSPSPNN